MIIIKNNLIIVNNIVILIDSNLININDLKSSSAISYLDKYDGINPYILKMKLEYSKNNKISLTEIQSKYIIDNHDKEPIKINRVIEITKYLGEELKKQDNLSFIPEKLLVEFILADSEKSFHVYGKLKQNQTESKMYWLPKTQIIGDIYFEPINIDVNFDKYNDVLAKYDKKMFNHQEEGVKFLLSRNGAILAFDMGMAKTATSIIAALENGSKKILVVCPSAVKVNWEREINTFCSDTTIIEGKKWDTAKFTIINFDILKNFHTISDGKKLKEGEVTPFLNRELINANFDLVIVDEAHFLKNKDSIRAKIMLEVTAKINKVWLLSGTPLNNSPMDFFNLLKIIKSPIAENWKHYAVRYCDAKRFYKVLKNGQRKQIWLTNGSSNLDELANKSKNIMLRRLKSDVLDLPDKIITPVYHKLTASGRKQYEELWDNYLKARILAGKKNGNLEKDLVELILLRQFIAAQAIPHTIEMVENAIEQGRKVIVFVNFTEELEILSNHFGKISVKHNGVMSVKEKQKSVDNFQNDPKIKVFIGNIKSAGVGITLTEATVTIFNSYDWVPASNEQCEDRSFRIGQKNDVNIFYQIFDDTISTRMWYTLKNKSKIINTILGDNKELDEIIKEITDNIE